MRTVTKKDVAKRTAQELDEKIYTAEKFVDAVFTVLRKILSEADPEVRTVALVFRADLGHQCLRGQALLFGM